MTERLEEEITRYLRTGGCRRDNRGKVDGISRRFAAAERAAGSSGGAAVVRGSVIAPGRVSRFRA
jgi:hypothetical protein